MVKNRSKMAGRRSMGRLNPALSQAFTLVEMLVTIGIMAILIGLVVSAGAGVIKESNRKVTAGEIASLVVALEAYKTDNGTYPVSTSSTLIPRTYSANDGTSYAYRQTSQLLYKSLSGKSTFASAPAAGTRLYLDFRRNQVMDSSGGSYVVDPWQYSLGYFSGITTGTVTVTPTAGPGFYDLWSTASLLTANVNTNAWIGNCTVY